MDIDFAEQIISQSLKRGADEAEVYIKNSKGLVMEVKKGQADSIESYRTIGYGIRIVKDKKVGFSYSNNTDNYRDVIDRALASSLYVEAQPSNSLPERKPAQADYNHPISLKIYDPAIDSITEEVALELILSMEASALQDPSVTKIRNASGSFSSSNTIIMNSKGINKKYESTAASASTMLVAEREGEGQTGWDYKSHRFLEAIDFKSVGSEAARKASMMLGAQRIKGVKGFVLLDRANAVDFLSLLAPSFSSESVQKGRSALSGRIGEAAVSPLIDIIDSGTIDGLVGSKPFDAEGVEVGSSSIVEKGILNGFLYNSSTAQKEGRESTGNAERHSYTSIPTVGFNNLFITASKGIKTSNISEMVSAVDKGIYVWEILGMHTANPVTGDFSVGVSGLWIEGGKTAYPFKEAMISGNIFDMLKKIALIGDDLIFYGSIGSPSLLVEGVDISA